LEELRRLQLVELQLSAIRRDREAKVRRAESHRRQIKQIEDKVQEHRLAVRERQAKMDALSLDVAAREESVGRHRLALNKAKTNKEYAAILTAMNTEKADNSKIEDGILKLMDEMQTSKAEGAKIEADRAKLLQDFAAAEEALRAFDAASQPAREALEAERDERARRVDAPALSMFNRCAQRHEGEAMAAVRKLRPKREDYACGGCNMKVTLDIVNALQTRDEIRLCGVCGRILYLETAAAS